VFGNLISFFLIDCDYETETYFISLWNAYNCRDHYHYDSGSFANCSKVGEKCSSKVCNKAYNTYLRHAVNVLGTMVDVLASVQMMYVLIAIMW
jgi:hypothetical protein